MNARILVVDDEPDIRFLLKDILEDEGYLVDIAEHARAADESRRANRPDLVLLDIWMPEIDGVTLLKEWKSAEYLNFPVVMMSGHGTVETAVEATKFGAFDFVEKPLSMAKLLSTVKSALSSAAQSTKNGLRGKQEVPVGNSRIMQDLKLKMDSLKKNSDPVFFTGADGSGRRTWASYLSDISNSPANLQVLDPAHELNLILPLKQNVYVDEITEFQHAQQAQLLSAMRLTRVAPNYRFILSSRHDYLSLLKHEQMHSELAEYWRNAIRIPSLAEHIEDIPELLEYYVAWYSEHEQLPYRHFGVAAQNLLRNHPWQGDISQLKQFIKVVLGNSDNETIELDEIKGILRQIQTSQSVEVKNTLQFNIDLDMDLREAREMFEREYLLKHLQLSGHNMTELAKRVGQERTHLYRKLKSLGLHNKK